MHSYFAILKYTKQIAFLNSFVMIDYLREYAKTTPDLLKILEYYQLRKKFFKAYCFLYKTAQEKRRTIIFICWMLWVLPRGGPLFLHDNNVLDCFFSLEIFFDCSVPIAIKVLWTH